jgi:hypothetical protein
MDPADGRQIIKKASPDEQVFTKVVSLLIPKK